MKRALLVLAVAANLFIDGGRDSLPQAAESEGLKAWKVHPRENVSLLDEENILSLKMSPWERINIWRVWPLASDTEMVKISYQLKFQGPWDPKQPQSYWLNLQEPVTYGNYSSGEHFLQPTGSWQTQEFVQMYKNKDPGHEHLPLRELPTELLINIQVGEGEGVLQLKDFRVQELVTKVTVEHR